MPTIPASALVPQRPSRAALCRLLLAVMAFYLGTGWGLWAIKPELLSHAPGKADLPALTHLGVFFYPVLQGVETHRSRFAPRDLTQG